MATPEAPWQALSELGDGGFDPLLEYLHPVEAPWVDETRAARYPLQLINRKNHNHVNSSFHHHDLLTEIWASQVLQIHPEDAKPRGIEDGARIRVFNDRGEIEAMAQVTRGILRGVVRVTTGWGGVNEKQTASILSPDKKIREVLRLKHDQSSARSTVSGRSGYDRRCGRCTAPARRPSSTSRESGRGTACPRVAVGVGASLRRPCQRDSIPVMRARAPGWAKAPTA